jgi:glycosyltransferase involved in cell wall biosynthesis
MRIGRMKLSIIIPTHNRADSLKRAMESIVALRDEADFEIVIVDNNSTDHTRKTVDAFSEIAQYVFEPNTSFTKARGAGASKASGDIFVYLDDDVILQPGSLREISAVFATYEECGLLGGKILPQYEQQPPDWALGCQQSFNGWSLFHPGIVPSLGTGFQKVSSVPGPMMAIHRKAYERVEGFPPDTIGVETNRQSRTFRKLYVGPGDYGICKRIQDSGYKIFYSPRVSCDHVIPKIRFTVGFWRSRMIGEAHHVAITNKEFYNMSKWKLWRIRRNSKLQYNSWKKMLIRRLEANQKYLSDGHFDGMFFEELWIHYYRSYLEMDAILRDTPELSAFLWELGLNGVTESDYERVTAMLPGDFLKLIEAERMYSEQPVTSVESLKAMGF